MDTTKDKKDERKKLKYDWVGDLAALVSIMALLPMIFYIVNTQQVRDLNLGWMFLRLVAIFLWLFYGLANDIIPTIISSVAIGLLLLYLIGMKLYITHTTKK